MPQLILKYIFLDPKRKPRACCYISDEEAMSAQKGSLVGVPGFSDGNRVRETDCRSSQAEDCHRGTEGRKRLPERVLQKSTNENTLLRRDIEKLKGESLVNAIAIRELREKNADLSKRCMNYDFQIHN